MKKMRVFYLVAVFAVSVLLLSTVNVRAEVLSVQEIIDVLVSDHFWYKWQEEGQCSKDLCARGEFNFEREGSDLVRVLKAELYYRPEPNSTSYQTLRVTGPVLKYITTINICGDDGVDERGVSCDVVVENKIEVVSKRLVKVNQKVLRAWVRSGFVAGDSLSCTFRKQ